MNRRRKLALSVDGIRYQAIVWFCGLTVFVLSVLAADIARAAPKSDLWERWTAHEPGSTDTIDHSVWDGLLKNYLQIRHDGLVVVDYAKFHASGRDALASYVSSLQSVPVSTLNRNEQYAYWVNLYNALTVKVVLDHYPVSSIRDIDISPGLFANGPWGAPLATVEGEPVSLDDIEHRILRPIWKDPRTHYAVNCASISCPNLQSEAFTAENTEATLDRAARAYVNSARGVYARNGKLLVSSIYDWFQEDFGGSERAVIEHLKTYAYKPLERRLAEFQRIDDDDYDWGLNDTSAHRGLPVLERRGGTSASRGWGRS